MKKAYDPPIPRYLLDAEKFVKKGELSWQTNHIVSGISKGDVIVEFEVHYEDGYKYNHTPDESDIFGYASKKQCLEAVRSHIQEGIEETKLAIEMYSKGIQKSQDSLAKLETFISEEV